MYQLYHLYHLSSYLQGAGRSQSFGHRLLRATLVAAAAGAISGASADAQISGLPVLQNAWATPGSVGALNVGGGANGSVYAAAVSYTPGGGRFQLSGGAGYQTGIGSSRGVYGARVAIPFGRSTSNFGFAGFAGIGGGSARTSHTTILCTASTVGCAIPAGATSGTITFDSSSTSTEIPIGAALGWRQSFGGTHGLSVYATPTYVFFSGGSKTSGLFRAAIGADVGITNALGATAGVEFGATRAKGLGGPSGTAYALGVSYAFGQR